MRIVVLGHAGMLGRRVLEAFPDAITFGHRYSGEVDDPLLKAIGTERPDWVINCIGSLGADMWTINAVLPHRLAHRWPLIQPSTDHLRDDTEYARTKRLGEAGHVIRCAIVDPGGGMLDRARWSDTDGETGREWNGITARAWARVARGVIDGDIATPVMPGTATISHFDLLETARRVFRWSTVTHPRHERHWLAAPPDLMMGSIEDQLREYL